MDRSTAGFTVSVVDPLIAPELALMVALPTPVPVAIPLPEMVATAGVDEFQVTEVVRFCVLPSL